VNNYGGRDQVVDGTRIAMAISGGVVGEVESLRYLRTLDFCTKGSGIWDG